MDFYVYDRAFNKIDIIDVYESAIWTDRYLEPGDFELYIPIDRKIPSSIVAGYYIVRADSEHVMIIETIKVETDIEDGNKLIVSGRSVESILDRRIVWNETDFKDDRDVYDLIPNEGEEYWNSNPNEKGWYIKTSDQHYEKSSDEEVDSNKRYYKFTTKLQTALQKLFDENIIDPINHERDDSNGKKKKDPNRKIDGFYFDVTTSSRNSNMDELRLENEYKGEDLLTIITDICKTNNLGFKIKVNLEDKTKRFAFSLYSGVDHSYKNGDIDTNYVVFSTGFDNLLNTNYSYDIQPYRNVTLIEGPEEDSYDRVETSGDENPKEEGWYVWIDGENEYIPTEDEEVVEGKEYFELDGWEKARMKVATGKTNLSGLNRRELFTDGSSAARKGETTYDLIPKPYPDLNPKEEGWYKQVYEHGKYEYIKTNDEEAYDDNVYCSKNTHTKDDEMFKNILIQIGNEKLTEKKKEDKFEGEIDLALSPFKYGKHFKIGDIVQIVNEYGFSGKTRVTEYVLSDNTSDGLRCYPKFESVEEED